MRGDLAQQAVAALHSEAELLAEVLNTLYWDCALPRHRLTVSVHEGWVTLGGDVGRAYERSLAESDARHVEGVVGVINEIRVAGPGYQRAAAA